MVCVHTFDVVNVQRYTRMVDEALEEFVHQLCVELPQHTAGELDVHVQAWAAREIHHYTTQSLVQRHVGVAVTAYALLVAHGLGKGLAQGDAHILHRVVAVDVQVTLALNVQIDQTMTGNLVDHVIQKTNASVQLGLATAVQIDANGDLGFQRVTGNVGLTHIWVGTHRNGSP